MTTHDTPAPPTIAPCPFCGGPVELAQGDDPRSNLGAWYASCQDLSKGPACPVSPHRIWLCGSVRFTRDEAIAAWNRRAPTPQPHADDEALLALCDEIDSAIDESLVEHDDGDGLVTTRHMVVATRHRPVTSAARASVTLRRERDNAIASLGIVCREHDAARATADACVQGLDALRATTVAERDEARAEAARLREALVVAEAFMANEFACSDVACDDPDCSLTVVRAALAATPATPAAQGADASASASDGARWLIEAPLDCVGDVQRELIRGGFTIEAVEPVSTHSGTVAFSGQMDDAKRARLRTASRGMQLTVVPVPPPAEPPRAEGGANA